MKINTYKPIIFLATLLYPVYTLPWIIKSMVKNEKFGYFLFSSFVAYLAYTWIPYSLYDLTRHYERFGYISALDFVDVVRNTDLRFFFDVYMWIVVKAGFPKEFIPFSVVFTTYYLLFLSLKKIVEFEAQSAIKNRYIGFKSLMLISVALMLLQIRFVDSASGMRNYIAISLFVYGTVAYYIDKSIVKTTVSMFLAILFHFSLLPIVMLFVISNIFKLNRFYRLMFIIAFFLLLSGQIAPVYTAVLNIVAPTLKSYGLYIDAYLSTNGVYGLDYYSHMNMKTYLLEKFILPAPFYMSGGYLLFIKNIAFRKIKNFVYIFFIFIVITSVSRTMFMRYMYAFDFLFLFVLILELKNKHTSRYRQIFVSLLMFVFILGSVGTFYASRGSYAPSWLRILYKPAPFVFLEHVEPDQYIIRGE